MFKRTLFTKLRFWGNISIHINKYSLNCNNNKVTTAFRWYINYPGVMNGSLCSDLRCNSFFSLLISPRLSPDSWDGLLSGLMHWPAVRPSDWCVSRHWGDKPLGNVPRNADVAGLREPYRLGLPRTIKMRDNDAVWDKDTVWDNKIYYRILY